MYIVTLKRNESIIVGETEITLSDVRGVGDHRVVRLGFESPSSVVILRSELVEREADGEGTDAAQPLQ